MVSVNQFGQNNQLLKEISEIASTLHELKKSDERLFAALNEFDSSALEKINTRYNDNLGPVNSLRKEIAEHLLDSQEITQEFIEKRITEIEKESGKKSFKSYTHFSLLFPFFQNSFPLDVKSKLGELAETVQNQLKLEKDTNIHTVDFWGARGFGDDRAWTAIYNNTHHSQQTAKQLFIEINQTGLWCGMYDRLNQTFLSEAQFDIDANSIESIVSFFEPFTDQIKEDDYDKASFLAIGVKDVTFFKFSHPKNSFTQDEIQACIDAEIVVINEKSKSKNEVQVTQFQAFQKAKKGDLFYLCWGTNQLLLIGQFIDDEIHEYTLTPKSGAWKERAYRIIQPVQLTESYRGSNKWWSPNDSTNCVEVPKEDYNLLNQIILRPYFQAELIADKLPSIPQDTVGVSSQKEIRVLDDKVSPKLDVQIVAREFANIIDNLEDNKGQMLGVFGSWGRGKTFFVDRVKEEFDPEKYINITFNAWKYQETEAIWAYLYEVILDTYLADRVKSRSGNLWSKLISKKRTFILNFQRKGYTKFIRIFLSFFASLGITYWVSTEIKLDFANYIVTAIGIIGLVQAYVIYKRYYQGIKDVLNDYSSKINYRSVLGLQAEIQDELIVLVKHWLNEKDDRRIVLFVDDLDRCNEDKIIHIIDALRVMLDDDFLVKKLIIIVAVDELLLERAIELKYIDFEIEKKDKNLVQEYMDKLFIAGIKFPSLNREEQAVILENYASKGEILETSRKPNVEAEQTETEEKSDASSSAFVFPDPDVMRSKIIESEFFLLRSELQLLQKYSNEISTNVTPRGLRIYMYRYLLSKNLASAYMTTNSRYQLDNSVCEILAKAIGHRSANPDFDVKQMEEMKSLADGRLKHFLPKLIEMVVPY